MSFSSQPTFRRCTLAAAATAALAVSGLWTSAHAQPARSKATPAATPTAKAAEKAQQWSAWGGTVGIRWNRELARDISLNLRPATARHAALSWYEHEVFDLKRAGSLEFDVRDNNLRGFLGGALQATGGHAIDTPAGRIDLTDFRLVPRAGSATPVLDLVGADGKAWFYIDRLMYELTDDARRLAVRTMDLRVSPELAARLGQPMVADWVIADMELSTEVLRRGDGLSQGGGQGGSQPRGEYRWHGLDVPGVPGAKYEADLFMQTFSAQYSRCNGCTGPGGNGSVVFTPSSTLRNNVNNGSISATVPGDPLGTSAALYAADIPWYTKFTGNFPPYDNDQHPYLIWNLYRFNPDGTLDQIGRSGVKHAFLTINTNCIINPGNAHVLGVGCADVYGVSNNDSNNSLGPRTEIIPVNNKWGRCGSIYDTNCDGVANASGNGNYDQRMVVTESQFSGAAQTGATYIFESWYLARSDINILNSMATKRVTFSHNGSVWGVGGNDQYKLGPAIDRWVDPAAPGPDARSVQLATREGSVKTAVKVTALGSNRWRYDYAVMNLDFARVSTDGAEPNLRIVSSQGFTGFLLPVGNATITDLSFGDGDLNAANDWSASIANGNLSWNAPNLTGLTWGTLFRFSFVADRAPTNGPFVLNVANSGTREYLRGNGVLVPGASVAR
jgi:hypothetical protein